jgi:hypothetical protein
VVRRLHPRALLARRVGAEEGVSIPALSRGCRFIGAGAVIGALTLGATGRRLPTTRIVPFLAPRLPSLRPCSQSSFRRPHNIDPTPKASASDGVGSVTATYKLVEIATGKVVLTDSTTAHVDYDTPGVHQRFASARAQLNAQDQAVGVAADAIRNRLASYFVAAT